MNKNKIDILKRVIIIVSIIATVLFIFLLSITRRAITYFARLFFKVEVWTYLFGYGYQKYLYRVLAIMVIVDIVLIFIFREYKKYEKIRESVFVCLKQFLIYFSIICLSFVVCFNPILCSDYCIIKEEMLPHYSFNIVSLLSSGRYITAIFLLIYNYLSDCGISHWVNSYVIQIIGIILYTISAVLIHNIFNQYISEKNKYIDKVYYIAVALVFVNPLMTETYLYGTLDWSMGILFAVLGGYYYSKRKYFIAAIMGFLAVSTYQTNIIIMMDICLIYLLIKCIKKEDYLKFYLKVIFLVFFCFSLAMLNILVQKVGILIIESITGKEIQVIKESTFLITKNGNSLYDRILGGVDAAKEILVKMYGMLPKYSYVIYVICGLLIISIYTFQKKKMGIVIMSLFSFVVIIMASFSMVLVKDPHFPPRTTLCLFWVIGLISIVLICIVCSDGKKKMNILCYLSIGIFFILSYSYTQIVITDMYTVRAIDFHEAKIIQNYIEEYEKRENITVTTIKQYRSTLVMYYDETLLDYCSAAQLNRIYFEGWSETEYLNYVNDTDYIIGIMTEEEYEKYFDDDVTDIKILDTNEQIKFDGEVAYWYVY